MKLLLSILCSLSITLSLANTEYYRVMWRADPATTMVIGWNQIDGSNPIVYYDVVDHGTNHNAYAFSQTLDHSVTAKGMNNHFVRLTGLLPNTNYYFIIKDSNSTSQRMWFKTTPNVQTERLSFVAGGDSRNNRTQRQNANKIVASLRPHAVLFGGDYTNGDTSAEWLDWFDDWQLTIGTDGRIIPIVATRGNHESSNASVTDLFDVPDPNVYYKTIFGNGLVSAYTLNTEISISGTQTTWLSNELANDNSEYKIGQYHKPVRAHTSNKAEGVNQYTHWVPLFDQHGMDLVVECDSHTAKSTWPIVASSAAGNDEGFIRDDANGTVYVGEGCWGAPLRAADDNKSWTRDSGSFNQVKWIFIDLTQIEVRTIKTDNGMNVGVVSDSDIFTPPSNLDINNPANGAVIIIPRDTNCNPPQASSYSYSLANGNADAEERSNGTMYLNSSDIELINDGGNGDQVIGLEFDGLNIPPNVIINSAAIQFTSDNTNSNIDPVSLLIKADAVPNPLSISSSNLDLSNRSLTGASVSWSPPTWTNTLTAGPNQLTPDLTSVIQEVINSNTGNTTNKIIIIITGSGRRTAASYNQNPNYGARLLLDYDCPDADHDLICDHEDNCPLISNNDQADSDANGIGDACEVPAVTSCNRDPIQANNINKWIGPATGNWYDSPCNWSRGVFPTPCDDVVIDQAMVVVNLRPGAYGYGYTLDILLDTTVEVENGAVLCIEAF